MLRTSTSQLLRTRTQLGYSFLFNRYLLLVLLDLYQLIDIHTYEPIYYDAYGDIGSRESSIVALN